MEYHNSQPNRATSQANHGSLPDNVIDRLFARLEALYGAKFADVWKNCDLENVKSVWADELGGMTRDELLAGLNGCKMKDWPPTLPEFIKLCNANAPGGHPSANEAWALVLASQDESDTVVWTEQIAEAAGAAQPVLDAGDEVGARMAFRDAYERILRERQEKPRWFASLGTDAGRRAAALDKAVRAGLLTQQHATGLLPAPNDPGPIGAALFDGKAARLENLEPADRERAKRNMAKLKMILAGKGVA